ncbi:hypothetical protein SALBM311S_10482 [Streptomyces alboniger]
MPSPFLLRWFLVEGWQVPSGGCGYVRACCLEIADGAVGIRVWCTDPTLSKRDNGPASTAMRAIHIVSRMCTCAASE